MFSTSANVRVQSNLRLKNQGNRIAVPAWKSAHLLAGQSNFWNPAGIVDGHFTNLAPDLNAAFSSTGPGGRSCLYQDTGFANGGLTVTWNGDHRTPSGPIIGIKPAETVFGIQLGWSGAFGGLWILWLRGRSPEQATSLASIASTHVDFTPVVLGLGAFGNQAIATLDGVQIMTATIPANLLGSSVVGVVADVSSYPNRPANLPCLSAPATIVRF